MPAKEASHTPISPAGQSTSADTGTRQKSPDPEGKLRHNERARENQRTSRARRKELLNDLQRRVADYERRGVQATLEMQQAARRVAEENARLRALLQMNGMGEAEIDEWLRGSPEEAVAADDRVTGESRMVAVASMPTTTHRVSVTALLNDEPPMPAAAYRYRPGPLSVSSSASRDSFLHSGQSSAPPDEDRTSTSSASMFGSSAASSADQPAACCTAGTETSCEVAATILTSMQGRWDTNRARAALGCTGPSECTVKNTRVLELLDEAG